MSSSVSSRKRMTRVFLIHSVITILLALSVQVMAGGGSFPTGPDPKLTPGSLCNSPTARRYPEHIAYCERNVNRETKQYVISKYDRELGYRVQFMNRGDFKIDHFFPLCAGGSNDDSNLWPQHKSVYEITDPLEPELCSKMSNGRLRQADAIKLIVEAKLNLERVPKILAYVRSL